MIAWIKLDPPCWGNALNLAADCPLLTRHLSWEVLVRSLVWKTAELQTLSRIAFQARKGDQIMYWRVEQCKQRLLLTLTVLFQDWHFCCCIHWLFFFHPAWLMAVQEEKMSFNLCYAATYILLTLWQLLLCVQTYLPVQMIEGEWGFFHVHSVASTGHLYTHSRLCLWLLSWLTTGKFKLGRKTVQTSCFLCTSWEQYRGNFIV